MDTLTVSPRVALYAAFLDLVHHLQLLHVAARALGTQTTARGTRIA